MNPYTLIESHCKENQTLKDILISHSQNVAQKCLAIAKSHPELKLNLRFLEEAAILHDIGVIYTNAPAIHCFGNEPYICHGYLGGEILRKAGYPKHARVCERHTGTGLTQAIIEAEQLPLPHQNFLPETLEEQLICYADKFFSKTHLGEERSMERTIRSLEKFGDQSVETFKQWAETFG